MARHPNKSETEDFVCKMCAEGDFNVLTKKLIRQQFQAHFGLPSVSEQEREIISTALDRIIQEMAQAPVVSPSIALEQSSSVLPQCLMPDVKDPVDIGNKTLVLDLEENHSDVSSQRSCEGEQYHGGDTYHMHSGQASSDITASHSNSQAWLAEVCLHLQSGFLDVTHQGKAESPNAGYNHNGQDRLSAAQGGLLHKKEMANTEKRWPTQKRNDQDRKEMANTEKKWPTQNINYQDRKEMANTEKKWPTQKINDQDRKEMANTEKKWPTQKRNYQDRKEMAKTEEILLLGRQASLSTCYQSATSRLMRTELGSMQGHTQSQLAMTGKIYSNLRATGVEDKAAGAGQSHSPQQSNSQWKNVKRGGSSDDDRSSEDCIRLLSPGLSDSAADSGNSTKLDNCRKRTTLHRKKEHVLLPTDRKNIAETVRLGQLNDGRMSCTAQDEISFIAPWGKENISRTSMEHEPGQTFKLSHIIKQQNLHKKLSLEQAVTAVLEVDEQKQSPQKQLTDFHLSQKEKETLMMHYFQTPSLLTTEQCLHDCRESLDASLFKSCSRLDSGYGDDSFTESLILSQQSKDDCSSPVVSKHGIGVPEAKKCLSKLQRGDIGGFGLQDGLPTAFFFKKIQVEGAKTISGKKNNNKAKHKANARQFEDLTTSSHACSTEVQTSSHSDFGLLQAKTAEMGWISDPQSNDTPLDLQSNDTPLDSQSSDTPLANHDIRRGFTYSIAKPDSLIGSLLKQTERSTGKMQHAACILNDSSDWEEDVSEVEDYLPLSQLKQIDTKKVVSELEEDVIYISSSDSALESEQPKTQLQRDAHSSKLKCYKSHKIIQSPELSYPWWDWENTQKVKKHYSAKQSGSGDHNINSDLHVSAKQNRSHDSDLSVHDKGSRTREHNINSDLSDGVFEATDLSSHSGANISLQLMKTDTPTNEKRKKKKSTMSDINKGEKNMVYNENNGYSNVADKKYLIARNKEKGQDDVLIKTGRKSDLNDNRKIRKSNMDDKERNNWDSEWVVSASEAKSIFSLSDTTTEEEKAVTSLQAMRKQQQKKYHERRNKASDYESPSEGSACDRIRTLSTGDSDLDTPIKAPQKRKHRSPLVDLSDEECQLVKKRCSTKSFGAASDCDGESSDDHANGRATKPVKKETECAGEKSDLDSGSLSTDSDDHFEPAPKTSKGPTVKYTKKKGKECAGEKSDVDSSSLSIDSDDHFEPAPKTSKGPTVKYTKKKSPSQQKPRKKSPPEKDRESSYLTRLRLICRKAGIFVRNDVHFVGCTNDKQKIERLKEVLRNAGMKGQPSLSKVDEVNLKREAKALDTKNIIETSGRPRRRQLQDAFARKGSPKKLSKDIHETFSRIRHLVSDSDSN